jgi:hypothetical protein
LVAIALSTLGFKDADRTEKVAFVVGASLLIYLFLDELLGKARLLEPEVVRRRCHAVFRNMASNIAPSDDSLEITLFVPDRADGDPELVPIVRFWATAPDGHEPKTKTRFRTTSSKLIRKAWFSPNTPAVVEIPKQTSIAAGRAWHQDNLGMSEKDTKRLSDRTLMDVRFICNIALTVPFLPGRSIALVSITSERPADFIAKLSGPAKEALREHLQSVALMVFPLLR